MNITTDTWTLGMPYWDGIWDSQRPDAYDSSPEAWAGLTMYCDLASRETIAQYEGEDAIGVGMGSDYDWCRYTWTEDGSGTSTATTDDLWWCLDDLLWGPLYWWNYKPDGCQMTEAENRRMRGMPEDDLLYDLEMAKIGQMIKGLRRPGT